MRTAAPIKNNISANSGSALRYGMFIPLAFMIASVITCCFIILPDFQTDTIMAV